MMIGNYHENFIQKSMVSSNMTESSKSHFGYQCPLGIMYPNMSFNNMSLTCFFLYPLLHDTIFIFIKLSYNYGLEDFLLHQGTNSHILKTYSINQMYYKT